MKLRAFTLSDYNYIIIKVLKKIFAEEQEKVASATLLFGVIVIRYWKSTKSYTNSQTDTRPCGQTDKQTGQWEKKKTYKCYKEESSVKSGPTNTP